MNFEGLELTLVIDLLESMAVVIVVAYLLTRTRLYRQILDDHLGRSGRLLLVLIFGAFSIWGTLSGVNVNGAIANTRDLGPALGGLIGGPVVGIGAGLIGGLQRLAMGGWTAVPSALGAVAAGAAGGAVFLLFGRRVAPVWAAMLLAVFTESVLMGLNLLMARPFDQALQLVQDVIVPMILVNAAGMGLFVFIVRNEARERRTAAQKDRMEGELTVARDIQRSIVPTIFPPFPAREEFDLHAVLQPAREVGGDLYDFFLYDDDHLCLAIGDVSDKGVPASLFMAVTITLLRSAGARSPDPAEVLAQVNTPLCRGNDAAMFVTLFYGVYRVSTGELTYSTGGHLPPLIVRAGGGEGSAVTPGVTAGDETAPGPAVGGDETAPGPAAGGADLPARATVETASRTAGPGLGISPGASFGSATLTLEAGDALLLFTDGVTEAMDPSGRMFGVERLEAVLRETGATGGAGQLMTAVLGAVDDFVAGAEQYDDVTMLGFRRTT